MNQGLIVLVSALIVGLLSVAILCAYTNVKASKMPEQNEMVQIFISGAIVASFISWLVTSGMLHGNSFFNMVSSDVSSVVKTIDNALKGADESAIVDKSVKPDLTGMVGGFFKSMGIDSNTLQELSVGMPTF
jgi:flagellar biosynthesis protein FliQ